MNNLSAFPNPIIYIDPKVLTKHDNNKIVNLINELFRLI